jgi:hypothetical protein
MEDQICYPLVLLLVGVAISWNRFPRKCTD